MNRTSGIRRCLLLSVLLLAIIVPACGGDSEDEQAKPDDASSTVAVAQEEDNQSPASTEAIDSAANVEVRTLVSLNLRQGPGTNYPIVGNLEADTKVIVVGKNQDGTWLVTEDRDGRQVWFSAAPEFVSLDQALVGTLPVAEALPPTYDTSNPKVDEVMNKIPLVVHHQDRFTCASHRGLNNLADVQEGNVIGPHSGDFVHVDLGNVLFRYTNGRPELIREDPLARFDNGAESLPLEEALLLFQRGEVVWNGSLGEWPARGVTGCDPDARP